MSYLSRSARVNPDSGSGSGFWIGSAGILGEMQHASAGNVGLRLFPNKIDRVGEAIDSGQAMERTALPEICRIRAIRCRRASIQRRNSYPRPALRASYHWNASLRSASARGATESVLAIASILADDPSFGVFPRVAARGIGGVALCVLGKNGVMPGRWLDGIGLARDLIPELLHEEKFLGR